MDQLVRFEIGDVVFRADFGRHETFVACPDCLGSKHVKVVLGDGTEVIIECGGCDPGGYEPSTGMIRQYKYETRVRQYQVTGVKTTATTVEYELNHFGGGSYYTGNNDFDDLSHDFITHRNVFATREKALAHGDKLKSEFEESENKRLMAKTKDAKSWAWNATYHRRCIKDLERQLEYHRSKVEICAAKIRSPVED